MNCVTLCVIPNTKQPNVNRIGDPVIVLTEVAVDSYTRKPKAFNQFPLNLTHLKSLLTQTKAGTQMLMKYTLVKTQCTLISRTLLTHW